MGVTWKALSEADLIGRDLLEVDQDTPRRWRGPIKSFEIENDTASFERAWTALSDDRGATWQRTDPVPACMNTKLVHLSGAIPEEVSIVTQGMSWTILAPGDNLSL